CPPFWPVLKTETYADAWLRRCGSHDMRGFGQGARWFSSRKRVGTKTTLACNGVALVRLDTTGEGRDRAGTPPGRESWQMSVQIFEGQCNAGKEESSHSVTKVVLGGFLEPGSVEYCCAVQEVEQHGRSVNDRPGPRDSDTKERMATPTHDGPTGAPVHPEGFSVTGDEESLRERAEEHLRALAGQDTQLYDDQWRAIRAL